MARFSRVASNSNAGWLTLVHALRDNLEFQPTDQTTILTRAIQQWLDKPSFEDEWFNALEEICLFGSKAKESLRTLLRSNVREATPRVAMASLHLVIRLFGLPSDLVELLRERPDIKVLLPDLAVFVNDVDIRQLLDEIGTIRNWFGAIVALESPELYAQTVEWAIQKSTPGSGSRMRQEAVAGLAWSKMLGEMRSRAEFAALHRGEAESPFEEPGQVWAQGRFHTVKMPCSNVRCDDLVSLKSDRFYPQRTHRLLLCPDLSIEHLATTTGGLEGWNAALTNWIQRLISAKLKAFEPTEGYLTAAGTFSRYLSRHFARKLSHHFNTYPARDSAQDLSKDLVRNSDLGFIHGFVHDLARELASEVTIHLSDLFASGFARELSDYLASYFARGFACDFALKFARDINVDFEASDWEQQWGKAMGQEHNLQNLIQNEDFWWYLEGTSRFEMGTELVTQMSQLIELRNPLALPLLMVDIWVAATYNHFYRLGRHLAATFPDCNATYEALEAWQRRHPINIYATAFAWEEHAKIYRKNHDRLAGPHGALMLSHAAYAALMTGLPCDGPVWVELVEGRDRDDSMIEISYLFHKLCHFRDSESNARKLKDLVAERPEGCREVLDAAGIVA